MPTRADMYVGDGPDAEWLGSYEHDGYPEALDKRILRATTKAEYVSAVKTHLIERTDATLPMEGWPWVWNDSSLTGYAYAWMNEALWGWRSGTGSGWFLVNRFSPSFGEEDDGSRPAVRGEQPRFPDMSGRRKPRSVPCKINKRGMLMASIPKQKRE